MTPDKKAAATWLLAAIGLAVAVLGTGTAMAQGTPDARYVAALSKTVRDCVSRISSSGKYDALKQHTSLDDPRFIDGPMVTDERYASAEEIELIKQAEPDYAACKRALFDGLSERYPDLQLAMINAEVRSDQNKEALVERKVTWGQYNLALLNGVRQLDEDAGPIVARINNQIALEQNEAAENRQRVFRALAALAAVALALHDATVADRPVLTTCHDAGLGWTTCTSN